MKHIKTLEAKLNFDEFLTKFKIGDYVKFLDNRNNNVYYIDSIDYSYSTDKEKNVQTGWLIDIKNKNREWNYLYNFRKLSKIELATIKYNLI